MVRSNTYITDEKIEALENRDFIELANHYVTMYGSMGNGFHQFIMDMQNRSANDPVEDPNLTRLCVQLYNKALRDHEIDDEMQLFYHFTSSENAEAIVQEGSINAAGKNPIGQMKDLYKEGGLSGLLKGFFHVNNWERVAVHVAGETPPEVVKPIETNLIRAMLKCSLRMAGLKPKSLGIPSEKLSNYFEIVTPKSANLFKKTMQARIPGLVMDEQYLDTSIETSLHLGGSANYCLIGPKNNPLYR